MFKGALCWLLLAALVYNVALAAPRTLTWAALSEDSLLGPVETTAQLQREFQTDRPVIARGADEIGLSPSDFDRVALAVENGQARYVTLPRYLDAMAGAHHGVTFADRDIFIPEGVHGWEVDLAKPNGTLRVFLPNTCGNISYVFERYRVAAARYGAPITYAAPVAVAAPHAAAPFAPPPFMPLPPAAAPQAIATSVPTLAIATPQTPHSSPHLAWLGALILPLILGLSGGHGGTGSTPVAVTVPPSIPTPIPVHTICPTAVHIH
jgi:hypothetical protein